MYVKGWIMNKCKHWLFFTDKIIFIEVPDSELWYMSVIN